MRDITWHTTNKRVYLSCRS